MKQLIATLGLLLLCAGSVFGQAMPPWCDPETGALVASDIDLDKGPDRFFFSVDYLLYWIKDAPLDQPLVTGGASGDDIPAALGQPGTSVIYGGQSIGFGEFSGVRAQAALALTSDASCSLEASWLQLQQRSASFSIGSDQDGRPTLGRPIINAASGQEGVELISVSPPGEFAGGIVIENTTRLQGWEVNLAFNVIEELDGIDVLIGCRHLDLLESLTIDEQFRDTTGVPGGAGLTWLGQLVTSADPLRSVEKFRTANHFYGPQLGTRYVWWGERWRLTAQGKLAVGWTHEVLNIEGQSTYRGSVQGPALPTTATGGVLALSSNIGRYSKVEHAVVPEFDLNVSYFINSRMEVRLGYNFLYWSVVNRPGDTIDRTVNRALVPTDPAFNPNLLPNRPHVLFEKSDFWAQGLTIGVAYLY